MLFNYENLDKCDSSEDCLVAKVLLGLIFNPFVPANSNGNYKLSREFLKYYLGDKANDLNFSNAEILFKPKYSWFNSEKKEVKDRTAPDLLLLFPKAHVIIAFEVKYTLPIQNEDQINREYAGLKILRSKFAANEMYLCLLMTHNRLFQHINGRPSNKGLLILRQCCCCKDYGDEFRINTWNCVYKVVQDTKDEHLPGRKEILDFLDRKKNYMTNPLDGSKKTDEIRLIWRENDTLPVYNCNELKKLIYENCSRPQNAGVGRVVQKSPFKSCFDEKNRRVFARLVERAKNIGIQEKHKTDEGDYINCYCPTCNRVAFQVHRHTDTGNVALAIPDVDGKCPKMKEPIAEVPVSTISGYYGNEKQWLQGYKGGKYPFKPVKVFRLSESIISEFNSGAWEKVDGLLRYALDQCHKKNGKD